MKSSNQICWSGQGVKLAYAAAAEGPKGMQEWVAPYFFLVHVLSACREGKSCSSCLESTVALSFVAALRPSAICACRQGGLIASGPGSTAEWH